MSKKEPLLGDIDVSESFKTKDAGEKKPEHVAVSYAKESLHAREKPEEKKREYKAHEFRPKNLKGKDDRNFLIRHYDKNYKKLLLVPLAVLIASAAILLISYAQTGEFFQKDVSIKGGVTVTILQDYEDLDELESYLSSQIGTAVNARRLTGAGTSSGIILDAGIEKDEEVQAFLAAVQQKTGKLSAEEYSTQIIGSALGASFFSQITRAIIFAFISMAIVVFVYFRLSAGTWIVVPGLFVIWTVLVDIISTLAVVSLLQIKVSTAGLAAFLLLIGYSVDTDILLTMRMLKSRHERLFDRVMSAARTGVFMTVAGMLAVIVGLLVTRSETIRQIMLILVIGLAFDLLNTWLTNTGVLRWYMERKRYDPGKN